MKFFIIYIMIIWPFESMALGNRVIEKKSIKKCEKIALVVLLGNINQYDGKCIRTSGVISIGVEWHKIYMNKESFYNSIYLNSLSMGFDAKEKLILKQYHGRYVKISGIYHNRSNSISSVRLNMFYSQ